MSRYESRADLAVKIDNEGGLYGFLRYGFHAADCPEGDIELAQVSEHLLTLWAAIQRVEDAFMELLPDPSEIDWDE